MRSTSHYFSLAIIIFLIPTAELIPQHMTNRLQLDLSGKVENETFSFHFDLKPSDDVPVIVMNSCDRHGRIIQRFVLNCIQSYFSFLIL
jgi:hypothetical protein